MQPLSVCILLCSTQSSDFSLTGLHGVQHDVRYCSVPVYASCSHCSHYAYMYIRAVFMCSRSGQ
jgi:hypothetical protein